MWPDLEQHEVPIIRSNSATSKQIRITLILAIVARVLSTSILQPTYLLPSNSGVRDLLVSQAKDESRKEMAIRSSIHALLPKSQASEASKRVQQTCDKIVQIVEGVIAKTLLPGFRERLEEIVEDTRERWGHIVRLKSAVEPSFALEDDSDLVWHELRLDAGQTTVAVRFGEANRNPDEDLLVVFPRCYMCDQEGDIAVSHGVVLSTSQVLPARKEGTTHPSKIRRTNTTATRTRRASKDGPAQSRNPGPKGFLS